MECDNQIGVRNIIIRFFDCDNNVTYGPVTHELAGDEQPTYRLCAYTNEPLTGGFVRRTRSNNQMTLTVIRNLGVPLALYQGCSSVDITVEHFNGMVMTGLGGTLTGEESSDGHEVSLTATFEEIDELLPTQLESQAA